MASHPKISKLEAEQALYLMDDSYPNKKRKSEIKQSMGESEEIVYTKKKYGEFLKFVLQS